MKTLNNEGKPLSIENILSLVNSNIDKSKLSQFGIWFRGQSDFKYSLTPSIFRQGIKYDATEYDEMGMYREFLLLRECQGKTNLSSFEWLTFMQHYNVPTRLLDWTESLFVALYFSANNKENDGALYIMDPISLNSKSDPISGRHIFDQLNTHVIIRANLSRINELNKIVILDEIIKIKERHNLEIKIEGNIIKKRDIKNEKEFNESPWWNLSIQNPIAVRPPQQNDRLFLQKGMFSLHGGKILNGKYIVESTLIEEILGDDLVKIKIPHESKILIEEELLRFGINEAAIFPELEHQSNFIKKRNTIKRA